MGASGRYATTPPPAPDPEDLPELDGHRVLVVGASRGFGTEVVRSLLAAGASVMAGTRAERSPEQELGDQSGGLLYLRIDITNPEDVADLPRALRRFGVTGVVNCAGIYGPLAPIEATDTVAWETAIDVNLVGAARLLRASVPHLDGGSFVQISGGGASSPMPTATAYAASKAGVVRLIESVAREHDPDGLRINALGPGGMLTDMVNDVLASPLADAGMRAANERLKETGGVDPRLGARAVAWLLTEAFRGVSGRFFSTVWDDWRDPAALAAAARADVDLFTLRRLS
jgi:NAD(P)-dependent dehydrogenase (short-subunit alcohol dehydrogenase family)